MWVIITIDNELPRTRQQGVAIAAQMAQHDALKKQISEYAMAHPVVMANPRAITSPQDIFEIMELAA